jgi:hypothetical protein
MPNIDISSNFRGGRGGKRHERARGGLEPRREEPADRLARAEYEELKARTPDMTVSFEEWYGFREHERNRTVQGFSALPDITAASHKKILDTPADDARANADPAWDAVIAGGTAWRGKTQDDWVRTLMLEHRSGVPAPLMDSVSEALDAARIRVSITDDYETFSELDARTLRWLSAHNDNMKIARDDARALDGVTAALRGLDAALDFIPENGPITAYAKAISPERPASAALDIRGGLSDVLMSWSHGNLKKSRDGDLVLFEAINLIEAYVRAQAATPRLPGIPMPPATLSGSPRIPNAEALYPDDQAEARAAWKPAPMDPENSTAASGAIKDAIREMPAYRGIQTGYNLVMSGLASLYRRMFLDDSWDGGWDLNADLLGSWTEMKRETARRKAGLWYAAAKKTDPGPYLLPPEGTWARFGHEALRSSIYPVASAAEFMLTAAVTKNILAPSLEAVDAFADASQAARYAADMSRFANAAAFAYGTWNGIDGEAAAQAGAVFERGIEDGMSYAEARAAEVSTYWRNAAVLSLSDPLQNALTFGLVNPFARMLGESRAARGAAWALEHGMSGLFEGGEEWFQAEIDNAALGLPRDERRMWKEFGMGAAMGLIYSSVGAGARRLADSRARVNRSKADGALLDILIAAAEATKTAKRIPEALDDFVAQASEGKLEDLWIDGDVLYGFAQSAGVKSHEELADVLGVPDDYREEFTEMLKTGSDVRASASALVSRMAADPEKYKEIRRHLKFNPSDMSLDEAEKAEKSLSADEKAAAAAMRNAVHEAEEHGDRFADFVRDMKEQFQAVSRPDLFGPKGGKGEAYAAIHAAFLATKAERMGLSREELFRPGALRVTRGASGDVKVLLERDTGPVVIEEHPAYAQAMYRNSRSLDDFFDYAVNTPKPKKKSFVTVDTPGGVALDIPDDTIRHDFSDRHRIVAEDWRSVVDNIDLPDKYALGTINNDDTYPIFLKIATDTGKYGAVIDHSQTGRNIIRTVFKGTDESIDDWIKKAEAVKPDVTPAPEDVSANSQHSHSAQAEARRLAVTPAKGNEFLTGHSSLTDILQDLQNEIKRGEDETYYQGAYHGTPYRGIERMSLEKIGTGEGAQAYGWGIYSAEARGTAESYREMLSEPSQIKSFSFGDITLFRNGEVVNYSPRTTKTRDIVRAALIENILIDEHPLRDAYEADGIEGAKRFVREKIQREIDTLIEDNGIDSEYAKEGVPVLQGILKSVNRGFIFRMENPTGQLYRMEVPESDVLLDWDKPLSEQPEKVKDALKRAGDSMPDDEAHARMAEWLYGIFEDGKDIEGSALYTALESLAADDETSYDSAEGEMKAARSASLFLDSFGIPGLQYWDGASRTRGEGTHNFVVWNEDAMEIMETYHQGGADEGDGTGGEKRPRGFIELPGVIPETAQTTDRVKITFTPRADVTTAIHEIGHLFLWIADKQAAKFTDDKQLAEDMAAIREFVGWKEGQTGFTGEQHEKFADAYIAYVREGVAPSPALVKAFRRFRQWLTDFYRAIRGDDSVELSDEMRGVFDRMLAADEEIEEAAAARAITPETEGYTGAERSPLSDMIREKWEDVKERAKDTVLGKLVSETAARNMEPERAKRRERIEAEARAETENLPIYKAISALRDDPEMKLSDDALAEEYGEGAYETLPEGVSGPEGKRTPDEAAELLGFGSGDEMIQKLRDAPYIEEEILSRVEAKLAEEETAREAAANERAAAMADEEMEGVEALENIIAEDDEIEVLRAEDADKADGEEGGFDGKGDISRV